jgi:2-polyprenyl-3-methyl-5-hydroxy-6-metoxy-1,4-benzoquinol methylase
MYINDNRKTMMKRMKQEWNKRATNNPYHYVSSFRGNWDEESFFKWGEIQTQAVIDVFLEEQKFDPSKKNILEIGCGAGRMTRALASRFKLVYAYDVSEEYIQLAKGKNSQLSNVFFKANDGLSFPEIEDESIDFVFSGWTMQHMPTKKIVTKNIEEISRVLKRDHLYKIDPRIRPKINEFVISKLVSPVVLPILGRMKILDPLKVNSTFYGASFTEKEVIDLLSRYNLSTNILIEDDGLGHFFGNKVLKKWFFGKKIE